METRATKESGVVRIKYSLFGLQLGYAAYSKCEPSMNMQGMNTFKKRLQTFNYESVKDYKQQGRKTHTSLSATATLTLNIKSIKPVHFNYLSLFYRLTHLFFKIIGG